MADCNPERIVFMKRTWIKWNYIPVLNVLPITDSLEIFKIQDLYFKENQFEGNIVCFLG